MTDANNGQTISIRVGSTLVVQLNADNWAIGNSTKPSVLAMQGLPSQHPVNCGYPGGFCGTTTASFLAESPGEAQVSATRSQCGEALNCTPSNDYWVITVQVVS